MLNYVNHLIKTNPYIVAFKFQYFAITLTVFIFLIKKNEYSECDGLTIQHTLNFDPFEKNTNQ